MDINTFKASIIGGGARANQFRVTITAPTGISTGLDNKRMSYMCKAASLPSTSITEITVPFRGRNIYLAGDRTAPEPWETTFYNDTDFMIKTAIEKWSNGINHFVTTKGTVHPRDYEVDLTVDQLDRDDTVLKTYIFRDAWPTTTGAAIELTTDEATAIEEFSVTWRYQHFEAKGVPGYAGP
jgi:hypothetical protein